jgi:hypothetical protein
VQITRTDGKIEYVNFKKGFDRQELDVPVHPGDRIYVSRRMF